MWCKWCGQDVPAISSQSSGAPRCARCGREFARRDDAGLAGAADCGIDLGATRSSPSASGYEDWELDQRVQHLEAKMGTWRRYDRTGPEPPRASYAPRPRARHFDHASQRRVHGPHARAQGRHRRAGRTARRSSLLAWTMLSLGLMAFACGTALLVWSSVEKRAELWSIGMPVAIGGQVGLLLGLILQLERIWQNSRDAARKLDHVGAQLHELERATTMLHAPHASAAQAYYAHLADRADPRILLSDLQGQLDLLADEFARGR